MLLLEVTFFICQVPPGIAVGHCLNSDRVRCGWKRQVFGEGRPQLSLYRITGLQNGGLPFSFCLGLNLDLAVKSFH